MQRPPPDRQAKGPVPPTSEHQAETDLSAGPIYPLNKTPGTLSQQPCNPTPMTRGEREDLQRLVRHREKVFKSAAKQRSAELRADFENQLGAEYAFDDDAVWADAVRLVQPEVEKAQARIAARCAELGIPKQFAPGLNLSWCNRGYDNVLERRKAELRRMATTRIAAIEQQAIVKIEVNTVNLLTQITTSGLTSDAARSFLENLPTVEQLMPALSFEEIAGPADPPIAEQLVSSNALRQRRYRKRHSNVQVTSRNGAGDEGGDHG
jgi:hypothetical protein